MRKDNHSNNDFARSHWKQANTAQEREKQYYAKVFTPPAKPTQSLILKARGAFQGPFNSATQADIDFAEAKRIVNALCNDWGDSKGVVFQWTGANKELFRELTKYFIGDPECKYPLHKGLVLYGGVGTGKTSILKIFAKFAQIIQFPYRKFRMDTCQKVYDRIQDTNKHENSFPWQNSNFCFDDLGDEPETLTVYGNETQVMRRMLTERYEAWISGRSTTHLTTNLTPQEIRERYGDRVADRCREMFNLILVDGPSFRKA